MQLAGREIYHILIKRRGILLLIIFILAEIIMSVSGIRNSRDIIYAVEDDKVQYTEYMEVLSGPHTEEKKVFVNDLFQQVQKAKEKQNETVDRYIRGEAGKEEFYRTSEESEELLSHEQIINLLENQLLYISENPEQRYWIYENGWIGFFKSNSMDILLMVIILVGVLPVFSIDYERDMDMLNQTTRSGGSRLYHSRVLAGVLFAAVCTAVQIAIKFIITEIYFGLEGASYPLQSVQELFAGHPWNVSCLSAAGLLLVLRIIGAAYTALLIMSLSVWCRRLLNTGVLSVAFICIPLFIFKESKLFQLPLPTSFLWGNGFITGVWNEDTGMQDFFSALSVKKTCGIALIIMGLLYLAAWIRYKNFRKIKRLLKKAGPLCLVFGLLLFLPACSVQKNSNSNPDPVTYQKGLNEVLKSTDQWTLYLDHQVWYKTDTGSLSDQELLADPFATKETYDNILISGVQGNICYYLKKINTEQELLDYELHALELNTGSDKILIRKQNHSIKGTNFLNLYKESVLTVHTSQQMQNFSIHGFWVEQGYLYLFRGDDIVQVSLTNGKEQVLIDDIYDSNFVFMNGNIYYINKKYMLQKYSISDRQTELISDKMVMSVYGNHNKVLFSAADEKIYLCEEPYPSKAVGSGNYIVFQMDDTVFYYTEDMRTIYRSDYSMKNRQKIYTCEYDLLDFSVRGDKMIITYTPDSDMNHTETEFLPINE
ncbi:ABC-2 family transporter protein [uncultured Roseburia sp.]|uniref:Uncharacterized protein n=1 Tax=Brotonthovivens ammoniilytica TaxID=2981725 RepID=A0ABT2TJ75_9FIRM|nr:hypothetical protein [Brotonthovivens ammoniilytica]MCU6761687.1 hypothetical protein [Brotonthovivens ammoniilytica]SCI43557.1 ABC-2 family transporter protein [uncultured Roseburia sp.]